MSERERSYTVTWSVLIDAADPKDAAVQAEGIMSDPASAATVLVVRPEPEDGSETVFDMDTPDNPEIVTSSGPDTFDGFLERVVRAFPAGQVETDGEGQLVIHTGLSVQGDTVERMQA